MTHPDGDGSAGETVSALEMALAEVAATVAATPQRIVVFMLILIWYWDGRYGMVFDLRENSQ